jgi:homoprotocatechuate degradation regulator HpaR
VPSDKINIAVEGLGKLSNGVMDNLIENQMEKIKTVDKAFEEDLKDFDHSLPMSLLRAREAVMKQFIPLLRSYDLSPEQWRVIRAIELEGGLEIAEISRRSYLLAPSMSRIVQKLEKNKLIRRRNDKKDLRKSRLFLTKAGQELFNQIAPESKKQYANITEGYGYEKLELLYQLLDELVESLAPVENEKLS